MITLMLLLTALLAYCLGNLNGSILVSRRRYRKDVRACGSGCKGCAACVGKEIQHFNRAFGIADFLGKPVPVYRLLRK